MTVSETQDPPIQTAALGFGAQPFGTSPMGTGTQATAAASPDPSAGSRYIDPISKDYKIASTTDQQAQMPAARQKVLLALTTLRGSSTAVPRLGLDAPRKIGSSFQAQMKNAVRAALAHLTQENNPLIVIQAIDVKVPRTGRAVVTVSFYDVRRLQSDSAQSAV